MFEDLNRSKQTEKLPEITETDKQSNKEAQTFKNLESLATTNVESLDTNITTEASTEMEASTTIENTSTYLRDSPKNSSPETTEMDVIQEQHSPDFSNLLAWLRNEPPLSPERLSSLCIEHSDFETALRVVQPSAKREGFATVPDVTWDDVGSLQDIRQELQMAILVNINIKFHVYNILYL